MALSGFQCAREPVRLSANKACPQGQIDLGTSPDFARVDCFIYSFVRAFVDRSSDISLARYRKRELSSALEGVKVWLAM